MSLCERVTTTRSAAVIDREIRDKELRLQEKNKELGTLEEVAHLLQTKENDFQELKTSFKNSELFLKAGSGFRLCGSYLIVSSLEIRCQFESAVGAMATDSPGDRHSRESPLYVFLIDAWLQWSIEV